MRPQEARLPISLRATASAAVSAVGVRESHKHHRTSSSTKRRGLPSSSSHHHRHRVRSGTGALLNHSAAIVQHRKGCCGATPTTVNVRVQHYHALRFLQVSRKAPSSVSGSRVTRLLGGISMSERKRGTFACTPHHHPLTHSAHFFFVRPLAVFTSRLLDVTKKATLHVRACYDGMSCTHDRPNQRTVYTYITYVRTHARARSSPNIETSPS